VTPTVGLLPSMKTAQSCFSGCLVRNQSAVAPLNATGMSPGPKLREPTA
jgi:hypothetical protein